MSNSAEREAVAAVAAAAPLWPLTSFEMSEPGRVDALVAVQRMTSWVEAQQFRLMAAMCPRDADELTRDLATTEIGCALRMPPATVSARLHIAHELLHRLTATLNMLEAGDITTRHVMALVDAVTPLDDALASKVEARVLPRAGQQTPAAFRRSVQRAVLAIDPRGSEDRHALAMENRRVCGRPVGDGMGELWALLPLDGLATVLTALNAMAAGKEPGDERSADQRRADALVELANDRLADPTLPTAQGRRPAVQVTVAATTLLGLDDEPGDIEGYGSIPAARARALAFDPTGTWRRLLTDAAGRLLDYGQTVYRPPQPLRDFVVARDRQCRFPGCSRAARRCDIDHQVPFGAAGGSTAPCNCAALCEHHHRLKHQTGWTVVGDPAEELIWTSPTGHRYRSPPGSYGR